MGSKYATVRGGSSFQLAISPRAALSAGHEPHGLGARRWTRDHKADLDIGLYGALAGMHYVLECGG